MRWDWNLERDNVYWKSLRFRRAWCVYRLKEDRCDSNEGRRVGGVEAENTGRKHIIEG